MSNTPEQSRAIDPFASFNSNNINVLTRGITDGLNAVSNSYPCDVILDPAAPTSKLILKAGVVFKDDVMIQFSEDFSIDFTDVSFYSTPVTFNEVGYYYVCVVYSYEQTRPIPVATIKIIKYSERAAFNYDQYVMLKIVHVSYNGTNFVIDNLLDYDPENVDNKIIWTRTYASKEAFLPIFNSDFDKGKIIVDRRSEIFFIGTPDGWRELGVFDIPADTSLCNYGDAVYMDSSNVAHRAIANAADTLAYGFVIRVGDGMAGVVRLNGRMTGALLETGNTPSAGEFIYLSDSQAGRVTNIPPSEVTSFAQPISKCLDTSAGTVDMILSYLGSTVKSLPHNTMLSIQGGDSTERYHLTLSDYNHVVNQDFTHNNLTTKQGGDGTHFYHVSDVTFNNLGNGSHNSVAGLQGGDSTHGEYYHLSITNYNHVNNQDFDHANLINILGGEYHLSYAQYAGLAIFPPGTTMIFVQPTAPPGWTQLTSMNDRVLRVMPSDSTGGALGGSWIISSLSIPTHRHSTQSHTLTTAEMPQHNHEVLEVTVQQNNSNPPGVWRVTGANGGYGLYGDNVGTAGDGNPHTHGDVTPTALTINATDDWRPAYVDVIVATKSY